ncbi:MAG TPA: DUF4936 family protein [Burkholderiales bacterium]
MMPAYYIYYRVEAARAEELEARVRALQAALCDETGVRGRLMRKRGEPLLWMEVYEGVPDAEGFERTLDRLAREHGVADALQPGSQRRTECFLP